MFRLLRHRLRTARRGSNPRVDSPAAPCALAGAGFVNSNNDPGRSTGRVSDWSTRRPKTTTGFFRGLGRALILTALATTTLWSSLSLAASSAVTVRNSGQLTFAVGNIPQPPVQSNIVSFTIRTPAVIEFLKHAPRTESHGEAVHVSPTVYQDGAGNFVLIPPPPPVANPTVPLLGTPRYYLGEMIYLRLTDHDQNLDPAAAETVLLNITCIETGDTEVLRVIETGPSTGIFAGYIPSYVTASANVGTNRAAATPAVDGRLLITDQAHLHASYTDPLDLVETVTDAALIDPFGFVFDGISSVLIDGATITLTDTATGRPAQVYGDDGVSIFQPDPRDPTRSTARLISGGTASDSGGQDYTFPAGGFRFPYIVPGTYKFEVTPPAGYHYPFPDSIDIPASFGFVVVVGSRGEMFLVDPGPSLRIDIPLYPVNPNLWLRKQVNRDEATVGDFLQYRLTLENTDPLITAANVRISDRLPLGFRYQSGSARIDGVRVADPPISDDGRTLTFELGNLPPKEQRLVTYVVEVAAGAKPGRAVNQAQAIDGAGMASNIARAIVTVREAFFSNVAILAGRVLEGPCSLEDTEMKGLAGVRIYLEDGTFVVTDRNGRYHFEGVEPGTHVVQVDLATVPVGFEMIPCEETSQFAGRTFSQFVDLRGGTLWRVNFYAAPKPPPVGDVSLQLFSSLDGEIATLRAVARTNGVPIDNLRLSMMLPGSSEYLPGSARIGNATMADPLAMGGVVNLRAPRLDAGEQLEFTIQIRLSGNPADGELPAKALLTFDSPAAKNQRTPLAENRFSLSGGTSRPSEEIRLYPHFPSFVAELQETDRLMLEQLAKQLQHETIVRIDIVGHTDNKKIAPRGRKIFADNQALSEGRARAVASFLRERLPAIASLVTERGMGESLPVADNATDEGRALNRRVELYAVTAAISQPATATVSKGASEPQSVATVGATATATDRQATKLEPPINAKAPDMTRLWLSSLKPEARILWPTEEYTPNGPSTRIMVEHPVGSIIDLQINDVSVSPINFDSSKPVPNSPFLVSSWEGVGISEGRNHIVATIVDDNAANVRLERELWLVAAPEKISFVEDKSTLLADGIQIPTVALRLTDRDGHPIFEGRKTEYQVSAPHRALRTSTNEHIVSSAAVNELVAGADGLAYALLEPTTQAGEATISVSLPDGPQEIKVWLKPVPRDWILVGFAEGTAGHQTLSGNMVSIEDAGIDEHGYTDGRVKFFAKGAVKGEWLLTLAYDSDKPDLDGDSLQQIIDPDTYYPLYGDETQQGYEAASARDVYIKLERGQFYALFGDMQTDLSKTELSKYVRGLNGFKSELQSEHFDYTVFAAETKQAFVKDEIRGDGTSGRYSLSRKDLVINSEQVTIETRGRLHNEVIIKMETLSRHVDYDIDYNAGTLYFKRPVPSKDESFNPVFIVVRYETAGSAKANPNYGGRAAVKFLDQKIEVGASHIHEETGATKGNLYGADLTVKLTPKTVLHAEAATTKVESIDAESRKGDAWLAEISHVGEQVTARGYVREQEEDFGLGQQNGGDSGMRTYGVEGLYSLTQNWSLAGEIYRQENLETVAKRDVGELEMRYRSGRFGLMAGAREARDRFDDGETQRSRQVLLGGDVMLFKRLTLRANREQALGSSDESADFPTRTILGADLRLTSNLSLFAEQEFTWGDRETTEGTRVGFKSTPWKGGTLTSAVQREMTENGERLFALFGLGQSWQVSEHWSVGASLDRSYTLKHPGNDRINVNVPQASGSDEDFTAVSVGANYQAQKWSWSNRVEARESDSEEKYGISSGLVGELREGLAASAKLMAFFTETTGNDREEEELTLGLAWRPDRSRWMVLERLDLEMTDADDDAGSTSSWRIVNHLHANYRPNRQWQASAYYGLKYVRETFDGDRYDGFTDMLAAETRYNLTKLWDIGVNGASLHSWNSNQLDYSAGASVGFQALTNTWISAGYNIVGFEDDDFSDANYTADGPYVKFRVKFDQQSVREAMEWFNK